MAINHREISFYCPVYFSLKIKYYNYHDYQTMGEYFKSFHNHTYTSFTNRKYLDLSEYRNVALQKNVAYKGEYQIKTKSNLATSDSICRFGLSC